jgi:hypothetical protein
MFSPIRGFASLGQPTGSFSTYAPSAKLGIQCVCVRREYLTILKRIG